MSDFYPIGAVVAFAGAALPATASGAWLPCDGSAYDGSSVDYAALFKVIDFIYGKDDAGKFCVPDYRGQFLRGADRQGDIDPDAHLRRRHYDLYPDIQGNFAEPAIDPVGTVQEDALGRPKKAFTANLAHVPQSSKATAYTIGSPPHAATWKDGGRAVDFAVSGGDSETRPINVYVKYFIKSGMGS
ncbi:MAG TPA: phage tail protein [Lysobacter sp.]